MPWHFFPGACVNVSSATETASRFGPKPLRELAMSASPEDIDFNVPLLIPGVLDSDRCQNLSSESLMPLKLSPENELQLPHQWHDLLARRSYKGTFLNRLQQFSLRSGIKKCSNNSCVDLKR